MKKLLFCTAMLVTASPVFARQGDNATTGNQSQGAGSVQSIVDAEFPSYDANQSGLLEQPEFIKWMVALKDQEMKSTGKTLPASEISAWASGAFTSADADGSGAVSKEELIKYLAGGSN
ncbi:MAG TPA: EF-hand domain-containing protein [Sphingobium sp.]